jgi:hypothetical protein
MICMQTALKRIRGRKWTDAALCASRLRRV